MGLRQVTATLVVALTQHNLNSAQPRVPKESWFGSPATATLVVALS
jgi:hypothetical protein